MTGGSVGSSGSGGGGPKVYPGSCGYGGGTGTLNDWCDIRAGKIVATEIKA